MRPKRNAVKRQARRRRRRRGTAATAQEAATASSRSTVVEPTATRYPSWANPRANALPMLRPAPVTNTTGLLLSAIATTPTCLNMESAEGVLYFATRMRQSRLRKRQRVRPSVEGRDANEP